MLLLISTIKQLPHAHHLLAGLDQLHDFTPASILPQLSQQRCVLCWCQRHDPPLLLLLLLLLLPPLLVRLLLQPLRSLQLPSPRPAAAAAAAAAASAAVEHCGLCCCMCSPALRPLPLR
jgi:hypothetical protein